MTSTTEAKTEVGSYFIANYPPFSQWNRDQLIEVERVLQAPPPRRAARTVPAYPLLPQTL